MQLALFAVFERRERSSVRAHVSRLTMSDLCIITLASIVAERGISFHMHEISCGNPKKHRRVSLCHSARSLVKFMFPLYERAKIVHEDEDYNQISLSAQQFFFSFYTSHSPSALMMTAKKEISSKLLRNYMHLSHLIKLLKISFLLLLLTE